MRNSSALRAKQNLQAVSRLLTGVRLTEEEAREILALTEEITKKVAVSL